MIEMHFNSKSSYIVHCEAKTQLLVTQSGSKVKLERKQTFNHKNEMYYHYLNQRGYKDVSFQF